MGILPRIIRNFFHMVSLLTSTAVDVLRATVWEGVLKRSALALVTTVVVIASTLTMFAYFPGAIGGAVGSLVETTPAVAGISGLSRFTVAAWGPSDPAEPTTAATEPTEPETVEPAPSGEPAVNNVKDATEKTVSNDTRLFYYVNTKDSFQSLKAHWDKIDILAPQTYYIDKSGYLNGSVDDNVKQLAKERDIKLLPLVTNKDFSRKIADDLLTTPWKRTRLIGALLAEAEHEGYMGFQVDFENLADGHRSHLNAFMKEMSERFEEKGKIASIAVMSKWNDRINPEFDYRTIGKYAHLVTVMSYDEHYRGSDPGPVAGIPWVDGVATYTAQTIPPDKVLMGIPLYFRQWGGSKPSGSYQDAMAMVSGNDAPVWFNDEHKSPHFVYEDADGRNHNVWFENKDSFVSKMELSQRHGFQGFSAWRLGQEDPGVWDYLEQDSKPKA